MKILLPVDFSSNSRVAVYYSLDLFPQENNTFILFHCAKPETIEAEKKQFGEFISTLETAQPFETLTATGITAEEIKRCALETHADIVVLGRHGKLNNPDNVFGKTISALMGNIETPLIVVPEKHRSTVPKKIIYASDLTNINEELKGIIRFAKRFDALIHILHIVPEEMEGETFDEEQRDLQMVTRNLYPKIKFTPFTGNGIIEGIDEFVKCENPDLLSFYKHPGNLLQTLWDMALAEKVSMHNHLPVLLFRKEE
jgi:nucleotide-binding universal stress UspA family protein